MDLGRPECAALGVSCMVLRSPPRFELHVRVVAIRVRKQLEPSQYVSGRLFFFLSLSSSDNRPQWDVRPGLSVAVLPIFLYDRSADTYQ